MSPNKWNMIYGCVHVFNFYDKENFIKRKIKNYSFLKFFKLYNYWWLYINTKAGKENTEGRDNRGQRHHISTTLCYFKTITFKHNFFPAHTLFLLHTFFLFSHPSFFACLILSSRASFPSFIFTEFWSW